MNTIETLLQLVPQLRKEQDATEALRAENCELQEALEGRNRDLEETRRELATVRSLLRLRDETIRQEREARARAEQTAALEKELREKSEQTAAREKEMRHRAEVSQQRVELAAEDMVKAAEDSAEAERRARLTAEDEAKEGARLVRRMRKKLRQTQEELDQKQSELDVERYANEHLQNLLDDARNGVEPEGDSDH